MPRPVSQAFVARIEKGLVHTYTDSKGPVVAIVRRTGPSEYELGLYRGVGQPAIVSVSTTDLRSIKKEIINIAPLAEWETLA